MLWEWHAWLPTTSYCVKRKLLGKRRQRSAGRCCWREIPRLYRRYETLDAEFQPKQTWYCCMNRGGGHNIIHVKHLSRAWISNARGVSAAQCCSLVSYLFSFFFTLLDFNWWLWWFGLGPVYLGRSIVLQRFVTSGLLKQTGHSERLTVFRIMWKSLGRNPTVRTGSGFNNFSRKRWRRAGLRLELLDVNGSCYLAQTGQVKFKKDQLCILKQLNI